MTGSPRALMPDYLRLFALFGIVVVNVQYIAFSALQGFAEPMGETLTDAVSLWLVYGLALLKTYGLFSFMFGVGLGFMMRSAERRHLPAGRLYRNRMLGLLLLGVVHGCLFFPGDILVIYAVTGSVLYLFRNWPVVRLARLGFALLLLQVVIGTPLLVAPDTIAAEIMEFERDAMTSDYILDAVIFRSIGFAFIVPVFLLVQGISALGWFCLGLAAVKSGLIDQSGHPLWQRARRFCLLPGIFLSLAGAAILQWGPSVPGAALTVAVAPIATLGYLGAIAALARPPGRLLARALSAGGSSLSVYLGQSIVLSTLFSGYGFGLWEKVDRLTAIVIALVVTAILILALSIWHNWFRLGPFEWVLRRITYGRSIAWSSDSVRK